MKYEGTLRRWGDLSEEERLAFPLLYFGITNTLNTLARLKLEMAQLSPIF